MIRAGLFCSECGGAFPMYSREVFNSRVGRIHKPCQNGRPVILKRVLITDEPGALKANAMAFQAAVPGAATVAAPTPNLNRYKRPLDTGPAGPDVCATCGDRLTKGVCALNNHEWPHSVTG